ncbi:MAG: hypothetical protein ACYTJ0_14970 [Planctomycetota bacterium]|jgi:hypothetical protein
MLSKVPDGPRLIRAASIALVVSAAGCAIDSAGNVSWTEPSGGDGAEASARRWNDHVDRRDPVSGTERSAASRAGAGVHPDVDVSYTPR